uniref:helix-turn-helix domain-containing protein n=1 Tax=uncultured Draconibacterium sp. TaxID=1573823 RepID=UPI00321663EE
MMYDAMFREEQQLYLPRKKTQGNTLMNTQIKIKELRERKGLSQEELCENSGVSLRTIQRIENGESVPRGSTLKNIATSLNVSSDLLINTPVEKKETAQPTPDKTRKKGIRFPWYIFGFTIIGASIGFLIGTILLLWNIIPESNIAGMIIIPSTSLTGAIGMVVGKYIESKSK